jgi:DNA-directed RNA polymerase alpha subunit
MSVNAKNWQELKKPNGLEKKSGTGDGKRKATFVAEPLERGFGLTLGNALRRVLLSSLQGAAVTSIKIENVLHEFSSLAGVREDVTDIVLNVKQIALRMQGEGPKRLQLSATGPATVTAGDIAVSGDIEVLNPTLVICHLDDGATLNMELTADVGKGYVAAVANRPADAPIGLIPIDALYSPVKQVSYKVENTRVGQELDYDKLTLTIETDGTVTPEDAVGYAGRILVRAVRRFAGLALGADRPCRTGLRRERSGGRHAADQPLPAQEGRRARTVGAQRELPQERQHHLYRRSGAEDRSRDAAHAEFRAQVAERDQGSAVVDGPAAGDGNPGLAAGEYRGNGQEARTGDYGLSCTGLAQANPETAKARPAGGGAAMPRHRPVRRDRRGFAAALLGISKRPSCEGRPFFILAEVLCAQEIRVRRSQLPQRF